MTDPVKQWRDIEGRYTGGGLVIGNGASIAVDPKFSYSSLYEHGCVTNQINETTSGIFDAFDTENFEQVLYLLWVAKTVNEKLQIAHTHIDDNYQHVRSALIETVRGIHPNRNSIESKLRQGTQFLQNFRTIVSLNYDLVLYWAILINNDDSRRTRQLKDCFAADAQTNHGKSFRPDWTTLRERLDARPVGIVCYPHGNLALLESHDTGSTIKLTAPSSETLINSITHRWSDNVGIPVFVSEGRSQDKLRHINSNPYLSTVYGQMLPTAAVHEDKKDSSLVFLGWSMPEQDDHILTALNIDRVNRFAIGINPNDPNVARKKQAMAKKILDHSDTTKESPHIDWFDYKSPGCWINTDTAPASITSDT